MDDLPIGPMLAVVTLLILWSGLFTAIEAAHQHLLAQRTATRSSDKPVAKLSFPLASLIFCNTLCRALVVVISTLLAIFTWAENGPWVACLGAGAMLLVFSDYLPRALAARYPDAILAQGNNLLRLPLKIIYPAAWLLNSISQLLARPFARKAKVVQQSEDEALTERHAPSETVSRPHPLPGIHALDNITVNDILVPRSDVDGINLDDPLEEIIEQLRHNRRTRLPVFHSDINQVEAILNTRHILHLLPDASLTRKRCWRPATSRTSCRKVPRYSCNCSISISSSGAWAWWSTNTAKCWASSPWKTFSKKSSVSSKASTAWTIRTFIRKPTDAW